MNSEKSILNEFMDIPEPGRPLIVVFKDNSIMAPVFYYAEKDAWYMSDGCIREKLIRYWLYIDEFKKLLKISDPDLDEYKKLLQQSKDEDNQNLERIKIKILSLFSKEPEITSKTIH